MTLPTALRDSVQTLLKTTGFAVLATENSGQPHTSLIAITPLNEGRTLVFATYRDTQKFANLLLNPRVSVLMDGRCRDASGGDSDGLILSAVGRVREIDSGALAHLLAAHLQRHPDLATFVQAPDCVLLEVEVERYQVVRGIDDVTWWCVDDLKTRSEKS